MLNERRYTTRFVPVRLRTIALYVLFFAAWIGVAFGIAPAILASAYHGQSLPILNGLFLGRAPHAFAYYLDRWNSLSGAVLLAGVIHLSLVVIIGRIDRRLARTGAAVETERRQESRANRIYILFSLAFLAVTVLSRTRHDYGAHLMIWDVVLHGGDPWWVAEGQHSVLNAYGPLFNLLAALVRINPLAPKLLFASSYLLFVIWLLKDLAHRRGLVGLPTSVLIAWILNPFPWIEIAYFGHFDIVVAVACVAAVHCRERGWDVVSGTCLALGVLLKYFPLVLLPFLVVEGRRFRPRLLLSAVISIMLGVTASVLVWGMATFRPLGRGAAWPSQLLSIFRFLRGSWSPLRWFWDAPDVDALARPCLLAAGLLVFAWCWLRSVTAPTGAVLVVLTTLLFYKVGFEQYQIVLFLLVSYWYWTIPDRRGLAQDPVLLIALAGYFGWLAAFDVFYASIGGFITPYGRWMWVDEVVGLPTFVLGCLLFVAVIRSTRDHGVRQLAPGATT